MNNLRRVWNPPNPYGTEYRALLGEPPEAELEIYEDTAKSILSRNDSPDLGFQWSVNPYRGCFHACAYCYARPTHEYFGLGSGTDFERKIFVKKNAPGLLQKALSKPSWKGEFIAFSGVTDCYQPLEAAWKLTRGCLDVCLTFKNPVGIITKSLLVRRDLDLLSALHHEASVSVAMSIPFWDEAMARLLEPGAPTVKKRFETLTLLAQAGIPAGIGIAPIIPGLNDADIPRLLKEAKRCGATFAFHTLLRLPGNVRQVFFHKLEDAFPLQASKIEARIRQVRGGKLNESSFGARHRGSGTYWDTIEQSWNVWVRRLGFAQEGPSSRLSTFTRPVIKKFQREFAW